MAQLYTVKDLLAEHPPNNYDSSHPTKPSLSKKDWVTPFKEILPSNVWPSTWGGVNQFLGREMCHEGQIYDPTDNDRLNKQANPLNYLQRVNLATEGDVQRDFNRNIGLPVSQAWQNNAEFFERTASGPLGQTSSNKTVDHMYCWVKGGKENLLAIGDIKKTTIIRARQWSGAEAKDPTTLRLGQEMRAYAYDYACPQMFVYSGDALLIAVFKAGKREDIKTCAVEICIVPRYSQDPNVCSARYALYRLVWRGWIRVTAELSYYAFPIELQRWSRKFDWWSGRTTWGPVDQQEGQRRSVDHPSGLLRKFDMANGKWYWEDIQGNPILDGNGNISWDSITCWTPPH